MYASNPFFITFFSHQTYQFLALSNDCHSLLNYEILSGIFLVNLRLILHFQCTEPLHLPVT